MYSIHSVTSMAIKCKTKKCCVQRCRKKRSKKRCLIKCARKQSRAKRTSAEPFTMPQFIIPEDIPDTSTPYLYQHIPPENPKVLSEPFAKLQEFSPILKPYDNDNPESPSIPGPSAKQQVFSEPSTPNYNDGPGVQQEEFVPVSIPYNNDEPELQPQPPQNQSPHPQSLDDDEPATSEPFATPNVFPPISSPQDKDIARKTEPIRPFTSKQLTDLGCKSDKKNTLVGAVNCPLSASSTKYPFFHDGEKFHSVEHFLLARKATAYGDVEMRESVMRWSGKFLPLNLEEMVTKNMKSRIGRSPNQSRGWARRWLETREESLNLANLLKFSAETNNEAAKFLIKTGDRELSLYRSTRPDFEGLDRSLMKARDRLIKNLR